MQKIIPSFKIAWPNLVMNRPVDFKFCIVGINFIYFEQIAVLTDQICL